MAQEREDGSAGAGGANTTGTGAVTRSQHQLHFIPEDWRAAASVLGPVLDRIQPEVDATQLLVVTGDVDAAAGIAGRLVAGEGRRDLRILGATDTRRAVRTQRAHPAQVLVATPEVLVALLREALLKLDGVRAVVLAWVEQLDHTGTQALETLLGETPKDAPRIVLASAPSPEVDALVERYARRARRMQATREGAGAETAGPVSLSYLAVGDVARPMALRRILDALDPESAFVITRTAESRDDVAIQLRSLGYGGEHGAVRSGEAPDAPAQLLVLYDFPESEEQLRAVAARGAGRIVALVAPRQLATLRRWAGGAVTPLTLPDAAVRARSREDRVRDEIREALAAGGFSRELLALEPLLAEHDGIEVAAALLRLLELERTRPRTAAASATPEMTRIFLSIGEMDGVRPGDLVGAITSEAGISKAELGRVEIRERHSTVEVATAVANAVVSKITGITVRGRRVMAKIDEGRERRDSGSGARRERGGSPRRDRPPTRPTRRPPTRPR